MRWGAVAAALMALGCANEVHHYLEPGEADGGYPAADPSDGSGGAGSATASGGGSVSAGSPSTGGVAGGAWGSGGATGGADGSGGHAAEPEPPEPDPVEPDPVEPEPEPPMFPVPSQLRDKVCWWDEFPNPVCKDVPELDPPIIEWSCDDGIGPSVARLRIPPGTCLRLAGAFDYVSADGSCAQPEQCATELQKCATITNTFDHDRFAYVHRRYPCSGWTAWWYEGECSITCSPTP